ncbi:carboxymuconolactone decarboxylase family protein [Roseococcus thiosulfatophilus]|uniref:carboxymuconolactone decarboxylase family protein n=1 Tax=Roseococcus thiosulfatophilus TaxID=35813 RepID=UPI001A8D4DF1|nr:carboxymuconolactone decarboxylase family protein [Roseococcus thiosulfatophilus]
MMTEDEAHATLRARGRQEMREILGTPFTEAHDAATTPFTAPVAALVEEMAYASLWTRPHLDRRQRSLITLAMLCALNHPEELRIHLVAALNNGCTAEEIREVFTHAVAYCGFPSAIDALRMAETVLKEEGKL